MCPDFTGLGSSAVSHLMPGLVGGKRENLPGVIERKADRTMGRRWEGGLGSET